MYVRARFDVVAERRRRPGRRSRRRDDFLRARSFEKGRRRPPPRSEKEADTVFCCRESDDGFGFWHRRRRRPGKKSPRQMQKTDVWRKVDEHVTAVVEASFRDDDDEEEEEEENALGGVVSDAAALELYLRVESRKQREACEKFASEDEIFASMSHEKRTTTEESIGEAKKAARGFGEKWTGVLEICRPGGRVR